MPTELSPEMLVVLDQHPSSRAGLTIAERYARGIVALAAWHTATDHIDAEIRRSVTAEPTIAEALRVAGEGRMPWIAVRRDLADPEQLIAQLLVAAAENISGEMPGFAVVLADGEPRPFSRILAVVDHTSGPISGLAAYLAVAVADTAAAHMDVLVLGAREPAEEPENPADALVVNREHAMFEEARARARAAGLSVEWIFLTTPADPWTVVSDQLGQFDYDLVIADVGQVAVGRRGDRPADIRPVVASGEVAALPARILTDATIPVLLVLDEVRLGSAPPSVMKLGAAAAIALGLASTSAIAPREPDVVAASTEVAAQELVGDLSVALGIVPDAEAEAAASRAAAAERASRSLDTMGARADTSQGAASSGEPSAAEADEEPKAPKPPKGGADPGDVAKARKAAEADKSALDKDRRQRDDAKEDLADAEEDFGDAQEAAEEALEELNASSEAVVAAQGFAEDVDRSASGLSGLLPGAPNDADVEQARLAEQEAVERLEAAVQDGSDALAELEDAEVGVAKAEEKLDKRKEDYRESKAEYEYSEEKLDVYKASLAKTRQSPVSSGYRLTARFGNTGGYWSGGVHTGLDFAAPMGTDIKAAATGTVVKTGWQGSYGYRVEIKHSNGYVTTYSHLSDIDVSVGQKVQTGDHIGDMGSTGNSTGSHLHFEVQKDGKFIDPETWLGW